MTNREHALLAAAIVPPLPLLGALTLEPDSARDQHGNLFCRPCASRGRVRDCEVSAGSGTFCASCWATIKPNEITDALLASPSLRNYERRVRHQHAKDCDGAVERQLLEYDWSREAVTVRWRCATCKAEAAATWAVDELVQMAAWQAHAKETP